MEIRLHGELARFVALAGPLYRADPVAHTVALSVLPRPFDFRTLLTAHRDGAVVGAALRTPPWPLTVSALPEAAAVPAVQALLCHDPGLDAVNGPRRRAEAFADAWCAATGGSARSVMAHRLLRLGTLTAPSGVDGRARVAVESDVEQLLRWGLAFRAEAVPDSPAPTRATVAEELGAGATVLWEVNGEPRAMASASAPTSGMSRIRGVYTPVEWRGCGYGSAVTAAASRWALDAGGGDVVLFTDLSNPVSNAIYLRLGYRPVHDAVHLALER